MYWIVRLQWFGISNQMQTRFHVDSKEASHEVEAPQSKEHGQLSGIHTDFRPLYVVELGAMAAFAKIDHADTPQSGANVGHGPSHMGGTNNGTEVRCAHGILQTACRSYETDRK